MFVHEHFQNEKMIISFLNASMNGVDVVYKMKTLRLKTNGLTIDYV